MTSALVIELDCLADTRVIELVKDLDRQHNDLRRTLVIVVVTSRPDTEYAQVADWLDSQGVPADLVFTKDPTLTRGEGSPITDGPVAVRLNAPATSVTDSSNSAHIWLPSVSPTTGPEAAPVRSS